MADDYEVKEVEDDFLLISQVNKPLNEVFGILDESTRKLFTVNLQQLNPKFRENYTKILTTYKDLLFKTSSNCKYFLQTVEDIHTIIQGKAHYKMESDYFNLLNTEIAKLNGKELKEIMDTCVVIENDCTLLINDLLADTSEVATESWKKMLNLLFATLSVTVKYSYSVYGLIIEGTKELKEFSLYEKKITESEIFTNTAEEVESLKIKLGNIFVEIQTNAKTIKSIVEVMERQGSRVIRFGRIFECSDDSSTVPIDDLKHRLDEFQSKTMELNIEIEKYMKKYDEKYKALIAVFSKT